MESSTCSKKSNSTTNLSDPKRTRAEMVVNIVRSETVSVVTRAKIVFNVFSKGGTSEIARECGIVLEKKLDLAFDIQLTQI